MTQLSLAREVRRYARAHGWDETKVLAETNLRPVIGRATTLRGALWKVRRAMSARGTITGSRRR